LIRKIDIRKIDNFLPSGLMLGIVFQKARQPRLVLTWANARPRAWASRTGNDSGMAPQTIEIAQKRTRIRWLAVVGKENRSGEFRMRSKTEPVVKERSSPSRKAITAAPVCTSRPRRGLFDVCIQFVRV
jgi:hypothetical protein